MLAELEFGELGVPVMSNAAQKPTSVWSKIGWLLVIWSASVMALFAAASVMRMFMSKVGMGT
ncbi:DUF2474 domain-containing protein [Pseudomonas lini]